MFKACSLGCLLGGDNGVLRNDGCGQIRLVILPTISVAVVLNRTNVHVGARGRAPPPPLIVLCLPQPFNEPELAKGLDVPIEVFICVGIRKSI